MIHLRPAYVPPFAPVLTRPKAVGSSRLARVLSRRRGGDGDHHMRRLMRIAADDDDQRSMRMLRELLAALERSSRS